MVLLPHDRYLFDCLQVESIDDFEIEDFVLKDYKPLPKISTEMAVLKVYSLVSPKS